MIRTKDKIFGEVNDRNTVISKDKMKPNKYIISTQEDSLDYRIVEDDKFGPKKILYSKDNKLTSLNYNVPNRYVGTDENGQLAMINKSSIILDIEAPEGRLLIHEIIGSNIPSNQLNESNYLIVDPGWYEFEISGAGGGAGSSVAYTNEIVNLIAKGSSGGKGGYYKMIVKITTSNTVVAMSPGNAGGGAEGFKVYKTGKSVQLDGRSEGGDGGRNFKIASYTGKGNAGQNVERGVVPQLYTRLRSNGGDGIHGGPDGGFSSIENSDYNSMRQGAGGGGASGPYGGKGGDCYNKITVPVDIYGAGGGGGAGGSFGTGGNGGRRDTREQYGGYGYGYGGAGGGAGVNSTDSVNSTDPDKLKGSPYSGAGGGGGGGSRLTIALLELEILVGGGGGGAGGAVTSSAASYVTNGVGGTNNKNGVTSELGAKGGESRDPVNINETSDIPEGKALALNMSGKNGEPGYVRIYKCI